MSWCCDYSEQYFGNSFRKKLSAVVLGTISNYQVQNNAANAPSSNSDIDYAGGDIPATCPQMRC
jgi:hypothetical protein